jgi:hypothetical protein
LLFDLGQGKPNARLSKTAKGANSRLYAVCAFRG